jgi:2-polyprenyl-3-methyl-5-hydroxy-6-metoxy-1,4-benzoquinol methylase
VTPAANPRFNCVKAVTKARLGEVGLFYEPRFDFGVYDETRYRVKTAENTLHHHILSQEWDPTWQVADLGANRGILSAQIAHMVAHVTAADLTPRSRRGTRSRSLSTLTATLIRRSDVGDTTPCSPLT